MATLKHWSSMYSACERLELTLDTGFVEKVFEGQQSERVVWSHADVLQGKADDAIASELGATVLGELIAAIEAYRAGTVQPLPPPQKKKSAAPGKTLDQLIRQYSPKKVRNPARKKR